MLISGEVFRMNPSKKNRKWFRFSERICGQNSEEIHVTSPNGSLGELAVRTHEIVSEEISGKLSEIRSGEISAEISGRFSRSLIWKFLKKIQRRFFRTNFLRIRWKNYNKNPCRLSKWWMNSLGNSWNLFLEILRNFLKNFTIHYFRNF